MISLVVLDMAGTTVDEQNTVYKTVQRAIERAGYDVSLDSVLQYAAGKEKYNAIRDVLEYLEGWQVNKEVVDEIFQEFEAMLETAYAELKPVAVQGAEKAMAALRAQGIKVVLNTGYKRSVAEGLLRRMAWNEGEHYDWLVTATDVSNSRPAPDMILAAMAHFGITDPKEVVKIGDSVVDIEEGKNAACGITAGVTTGAQTREQMAVAQPDYIFDRLTELLAVL